MQFDKKALFSQPNGVPVIRFRYLNDAVFDQVEPMYAFLAHHKCDKPHYDLQIALRRLPSQYLTQSRSSFIPLSVLK